MAIIDTNNSNSKDVGEFKILKGRTNQNIKVICEKGEGSISIARYVVNTKSSGKR